MNNWLKGLLCDWRERFTPYIEWMGELKNPQVLKADVIAGLTSALVLVPQSMAYAQLAGLPAYIGLYASFLPLIIAALFGSSRQLGSGPVALVALMTGAALQPFAIHDTSTYVLYAGFLALIMGVFQLLMGLFRLGILVDFLSHPVILGFTNAGALIIATSQLDKLVGVKIPPTEHHYEMLLAVIKALPAVHWSTLLVGITSLFSLLMIKKLAPRLPNILMVVTIATTVSWLTGYEQLGGKVVGAIPAQLPSLQIPSIQPQHFQALLLSGVVMSLLGFVEAISIAKAMASQTRQRLSANQELVGQGLGNLVAAFFQGQPISGSFSRSAVNFSAGAVTPFSSIVTGLLVAVSLLFLVDLLYYLPLATLAAVIFASVLNLIKFAPIKHAWKVEPHDGVVAIVTFFSTLWFAPQLERGIFIGVVLSLGLFLYRTMSPNFVEVAKHPDGSMRDAKIHRLKTSDTVAVYRFDGDLYFANTGYFEGKLLNSVAKKPKIKVLVLDMESIDQVDSTGEEMLEKLADRLQAAGIELYLARTKLRVYEAFQRSGLARHIGEERFFRERKYALKDAKARWGDAIDIEPLLRYIPLEAALEPAIKDDICVN